jgi:hypothetical protein
LPNLGEYFLYTHYDQTHPEFVFSVLNIYHNIDRIIIASKELGFVSFLPIILLVLIRNIC